LLDRDPPTKTKTSTAIKASSSASTMDVGWAVPQMYDEIAGCMAAGRSASTNTSCRLAGPAGGQRWLAAPPPHYRQA